MRNLLLAAIAVVALTASARAQAPSLVLHLPDIVLTQSSSPQNGSFDVWVEEVGGDVGVQAYNIGIKQSPNGLVTFSTLGLSSSAHPSLFGQVPQDRTNTNAAFFAGRDIYAVDDFVVGGVSTNAHVDNATRNGLFSVNYTVAADAVGSRVLTVETDPNLLGIFAANGSDVPFTIDPGSITITPVPEPAVMGLALLGFPLLARRRR